MVSAHEVERLVSDYIAGNVSLDVVEDSLAQISWNMHRDSGSDAQRLVSEIERILSEYHDGYIVRLRDALANAVAPYRPVIVERRRLNEAREFVGSSRNRLDRWAAVAGDLA